MADSDCLWRASAALRTWGWSIRRCSIRLPRPASSCRNLCKAGEGRGEEAFRSRVSTERKGVAFLFMRRRSEKSVGYNLLKSSSLERDHSGRKDRANSR